MFAAACTPFATRSAIASHSLPTRLQAQAARCSWATAFVTVVALLGLSGCDKAATVEQAPEVPAVGVIEVGEEKVNPFFEFVGKTRAAETVALRARVTGFLEERAFREGGDVDQGKVLFRIEPQQYQASLFQAQAALGAAEASLNRAKVDLGRYQELVKAKNVSQQKVDEAEAEVLVQEAAVETAKADIEKTQLNVDYTEITAPIAGRIDVAAFDVGNLVGPESGVLATINRMDPIKVVFSIAETWYLELVQEDLAFKRRRAAAGVDVNVARSSGDADEFDHVPLIRLPDGTLYEAQGRFDFFDNKVDEKTGTVTVRAVFPNPDRLLLPGQFVTVVIERKEAVDRVLIPQAAVLTDQGGTYVLLVNDKDTIEARRIETGQRFGPNLVVQQGLEPGERVVLYGIQKVRPGLKVKPEPAAAPSDPMDNATSASVTAADAESAATSGSTGETVASEQEPPEEQGTEQAPEVRGSGEGGSGGQRLPGGEAE